MIRPRMDLAAVTEDNEVPILPSQQILVEAGEDTVLYTSSPADKKYGSTLPTN